MASEKRNPTWKRDELILPLDLYFRHNPSHIGQNHEEVHKLSDILNTLPIHTDRPDAEKFRNPNGVYMRLCNFLRYDPGYRGSGLTRGGKLEEAIWNNFSGDVSYLRKTAEAIVSGTGELAVASAETDNDEEDFPEGRVLYRLHRSRERNRSIVKKIKREAEKQRRLHWTVCYFDF